VPSRLARCRAPRLSSAAGEVSRVPEPSAIVRATNADEGINLLGIAVDIVPKFTG